MRLPTPLVVIPLPATETTDAHEPELMALVPMAVEPLATA
jgi:hypothetical protein